MRACAAPDALPDCYDLNHVVLLAGFAFEAYRDPVGGTRDVDSVQGSTTYVSSFVREAFAGVLQVQLLSATDLAAGDITGQSDPYVVLSINDSAHRSATRRFTRAPTWEETARLFVREPQADTLRLRVMDEDLLKEDDTLGMAFLQLGPLCDGAEHTLEVPVQAAGVGPGGGTLQLKCRFYAFTEPREPRWGDGEQADTQPWSLPEQGAQGMPWLASLVRSATTLVTSAMDAQRAEAERRRAEQELWAMPPASDWTVLAADGARGQALPSEFEKVAFIEHAVTDTQACVWRCVSRRTLVVAFRGTETTKLRDIITDARLAQRSFTPERVASGDSGEPAVHDGFLEAWDSVRGRVFAAIDDARGCGPRVKALGWSSAQAGSKQQWRVWVTGHSLGGALATLCALELAASVDAGRRSGLDVRMVNFGSPRVGNAAFVRLYNSLVPHSLRLVNGSDAVPTVPALLGYRHVHHGIRLTPHGVAAPDSPPVLPSVATPPSPGDVAALAAAALTGAVNAGAVDAQAAAEAATALASLVDSAALEAHFEHQYLDALRVALEVHTSTKGEA